MLEVEYTVATNSQWIISFAALLKIFLVLAMYNLNGSGNALRVTENENAAYPRVTATLENESDWQIIYQQ